MAPFSYEIWREKGESEVQGGYVCGLGTQISEVVWVLWIVLNKTFIRSLFFAWGLIAGIST